MRGISDSDIPQRTDTMETKRIASTMQTKYCGKLACQDSVIRAPKKG